MTTVVHDALHADEADASYAKVAHQLLWVHLAKIRVFHHLVVLACVFKCQIVLGQLLRFKRLVQSCLAQGAESQALLFYLDQAHFTERVSAVEVARHASLTIEILVARGALHRFVQVILFYLYKANTIKLNSFKN